MPDQSRLQSGRNEMQDGKYVVLCVDDDNDVLETARILLEANDYVMVGAATGKDGLARYDESNPDFLLVDLMMEDVDAGLNLVAELKQRGNTAPVYMLSSVGDELAGNTDTSELGIGGVIQKPLQVGVLLPILKAKLGA